MTAGGSRPRARAAPGWPCQYGLGRFALVRPAGEEGRGRDPAVELGPARAVGERLLDPVKAPEVAAQVVDEMHERRLASARHDRAAVLELAVVAENDVEQSVGVGVRERLDVL